MPNLLKGKLASTIYVFVMLILFMVWAAKQEYPKASYGEIVWSLMKTFDPVQADLIHYINEDVPKIAVVENAITSGFASVSGENYTNDLVLVAKIDQVLAPRCKEMLDLLEKQISPQTPEVSALNQIYVKTYRAECEAFTVLKAAIASQQSQLVQSKVNPSLDTAKRLQQEWLAELNRLKSEHGVLSK